MFPALRIVVCRQPNADNARHVLTNLSEVFSTVDICAKSDVTGQADLLVSQGHSVATPLLDIAPFQHRVQDRVQLLLYVLNQQWLAK